MDARSPARLQPASAEPSPPAPPIGSGQPSLPLMAVQTAGGAKAEQPTAAQTVLPTRLMIVDDIQVNIKARYSLGEALERRLNGLYGIREA